MKLCACGCGGIAPIAKKTRASRGVKIGDQMRFIPGHHLKLPQVKANAAAMRKTPEVRAKHKALMNREETRWSIAQKMRARAISKITRQRMSDAFRVHGHTAGYGTPTYRSWQSMKARCLNPRAPSWKHYGGRGISVCDRWRNSFELFLSDMGARPEGTTLDRIDVNGNYEPGNCRWATHLQQRHNRRDSAAYAATP